MNAQFSSHPRILFTILVLAGLLLASLGASLALSARFSIQTDLFLDFWAEKPKQATLKATSVASSYSSVAAALFPGDDARILQTQALVYEWQRFIAYSRGESDAGALAQSKTLLLRAAELRPLWPSIWTDLARVKLRGNEIDEQFYHALERAEASAPWRAKNILLITNMKILLWWELSEDQKNSLIRLLEKAERLGTGHQNKVWQQVVYRELTQEMCRLEAAIDWLTKKCELKSSKR